MTEPTMAWVDMETTGLSASEDVPLELGIKLTDDYLNVIDEIKWLVREDSLAYTKGMQRGLANRFVYDMHDRSGLWAALLEEPVNTREQVDSMACEWLESHGVESRTLPMCGNSIGSLDRPFALIHFPHFNEFLSYRNFDISTFKECMRRVNSGLFEKVKPIVGTKENATHRVMGDIDASIAEYAVYLDEFIITGDDF